MMQRSVTQWEIIPNRIISRNNNYGQRKILINKKFEWLNKYLAASSPKIINPNKFVSTSKITYSPNPNCSQSIEKKSRIKTMENGRGSGFLAPRNCNYSQLRKTASSQLNSKESKKVMPIEENCLSKFFRSRRNRSLFSQKLQEKNIELNKLDESQIRPWKMEENEQHQILSFKDKENDVPRRS